jgi:hypothetical protein
MKPKMDAIAKIFKKALKDINHILDQRPDRKKLEKHAKQLNFKDPKTVSDLIKTQSPFNREKRDLDYEIFKKLKKVSSDLMKNRPEVKNLRDIAGVDPFKTR